GRERERFLGRTALVERAEELGRSDPERDHLARDREGLGVCVAVAEPAGVRHERGEYRASDESVDGRSERTQDAPDEEPGGRCPDVDEALVPPGPALVRVVIDDELLRG